MKAVKPLYPLFALVLLSCFFCSCGKEADDVKAAIEEAHFLLTDRNCSGAKASLDEVGYQANNADYIGAYASAYACAANYSTLTLFTNDLDSLSSTQGGLLGSLTLFSTSDDMTSATDSDFTNLQLAINTILYAGGQTESASANRETVFSSRDNTNLNVQALYMILVNLGRWLHFYGNPDANGVKGAGTANTNTCLYTYSNPTVRLYLGTGVTGSCTDDVGDVGSSDMMTGDATEQQTRLCQGLVMFTNFIDLIANIEFTGDDVGELSAIGDTFESVCNDAATAGYDYCSMRDLSGCLAQDIDDLEYFSALLFETNFN